MKNKLKKENRVILILASILLIINIGLCNEQDSLKSSFHLGLNGGLAQHKTLTSDAYIGWTFPTKKDILEVNFGYTLFSNKTKYNGVKDLEFTSHGLFIEGNYFLSPKFYLGVRLNLNFNLIDEESQDKFETIPDIDSPKLFTGIAYLGNLGFYQPISEKIGIKIYSQLGLHNHKITEGSIIIDNSSDDLRNAQLGIERRLEFLYNINLGFIIKLK